MKKWMKFLAFAAVALAIGSSPALADIVTNTFTGTVALNDGFSFEPTTNDTGNYFGGGNLIGDSFTLTFTTTAAAGSTFVTGGAYYYGSSPITASLTINNHTYNINDPGQGLSGDGYYYGGATEYDLQAFHYSQQLQKQGLLVDFTLNQPPALDTWSLTTLLPSMSSGDFVWNYAEFYTSTGERLGLDVTGVNPSAVPIPPSALLLGSGLLGLVGLGWRRKQSQ